MPKYHPNNNPAALPAIKCAEDVRKLPWGGNAWWDVPIMNHIEKFARDPSYAYSERKRSMELGGYLMTGENCKFTKDYTFRDWLNNAPC